jgi:hypothetical protein
MSHKNSWNNTRKNHEWLAAEGRDRDWAWRSRPGPCPRDAGSWHVLCTVPQCFSPETKSRYTSISKAALGHKTALPGLPILTPALCWGAQTGSQVPLHAFSILTTVSMCPCVHSAFRFSTFAFSAREAWLG